MRGIPLLVLGVLLLPTLSGCLGGSDATAPGEPLTRGDTQVAPAPGEPNGGWIPLEEAVIRPGVPITTTEGLCPSNFLFVRPDNTSVFLGTTAYCTRNLPVGSVVAVGGPENLGIIAYNSWHTMADMGVTDEHALQYNDFAVIRLDPSSRHLAHPAMLGVGGPVAQADAGEVGLGDHVRAYENFTVPDTDVQRAWADGVVTGSAGDWALLAHMAPPSAPGLQGGGVLTPEGDAVGIVVNLGVVPNPGATGIARLDAVMAYAKEHAKLHMELMTWELLDDDELLTDPVPLS